MCYGSYLTCGNSARDKYILLQTFERGYPVIYHSILLHFILSIATLKRKVLPECTSVVSSRPHATVYLREQATVRLDILGFTKVE